MTHKFRISSVVLGALFIVIAASALSGQFDDVDRAKAILPVAIVVVGVVTIATGVRALLSRDDA